MTREDAETLLKSAVAFQARTTKARERCREEYRKVEKEMENTLRITIDGLLSCLAEKITKKIENVTPEISYQLGVSASFIRSHFLIFDFVLEGCLLEATVLIRNQLESLARLIELDSKPLQKLEGKVPNIQNVLKGPAGKMYGHLSEVAHFSKPRVCELLHVFDDGDRVGPSLFPVYNERNFACFDMNCFVDVYFLAWLVDKLPTWYPEYDNSKEKELLYHSIDLALKCGVIQIPEETAS